MIPYAYLASTTNPSRGRLAAGRAGEKVPIPTRRCDRHEAPDQLHNDVFHDLDPALAG